MTGSIFVFSRVVEDGGNVKQIITVFAPDLDSARSLLANHLDESNKTSGPAPEYEFGPAFKEWHVALDTPMIVTSAFSHL